MPPWLACKWLQCRFKHNQHGGIRIEGCDPVTGANTGMMIATGFRCSLRVTPGWSLKTFGLAMLLVANTPVVACTCPTMAAEDAFDESTQVFVAFIKAVEDKSPLSFRERLHAAIVPPEEDGIRVTFERLHLIKGDVSPQGALHALYGSCAPQVMPGAILLIATDDALSFGYCHLYREFNLVDCRHVHLIDRMRRRAADGETPLHWLSLTGPPDDFGFEVLVGGYKLLNAGTVLPGDFVMADLRAYRAQPPKRGDIVVFRYPEAPQEMRMARIVALPGERIEVYGQIVRVGGAPLQEPYVHFSRTLSPRHLPTSLLLPDDAYFVMGDHRDNSMDSRMWGPLPSDHLHGRIELIWFSWDPKSGIRWDRIGRSLRL
ncbi:MAG TPA: signal peptidase I [Xanthomonadaceae bacterium]|nr:signal peptidase I [Xanthomonadaceae bacterium]